MATYRKLTAEYRLSQRWFPKGSMLLNHPNGAGCAYVSKYRANDDTWQVVAYRGTAGKPSLNTYYRTREQAEKAVESFFNGIDDHAAFLERMKADHNKPNLLKVGDIITNSWGYDQTNVDWYRVTRATPSTVWLKPIAAHVEETCFMSGPSVPSVDTSDPDPAKWSFRDLDEPEQMHRASGYSCTMKYGSGSKWDGKPLYCSWYA